MVGRLYRRVLHAGAVASALLLGGMAVLVSADILARNVGLGTLPWITEVSEYTLPLATFLVAPWLLFRSEHVRVDALIAVLPTGIARALDRTGDAIGLGVSAVFVVYGVKAIASSARQGSLVIKAVVFPEWWLYAPVPVCFALLAIEFGRRLGGGGVPAGVGAPE